MFDFKRKNKGQSILEIALFGSLILAILGIMLQYGLKYNFQQRAMMKGFRRTLGASGEPNAGGQGSYTYFEDRHIPDPSGAMAVGSVTAFMGGGSVIRNYRLHETPDNASELPVTYIRINDDANTFVFRSADFRTENIAESNYAKYKEVYGDLNIKDPSTNGDLVFEDVCITYDSEGNCTEWSETTQLQGRIMDACEGNMIGYDACKRQCRMMEDTDDGRALCRRECERGKAPGDDKDCNSICDQSIPQPWYCSSLDSIFSFAIAQNKPKAMGIQPDFTKQITKSEALRKQEAGGVITTSDTINWSDTTQRSMVYIDSSHAVQTVPLDYTLGESVTQTCVDGTCN